MGDGLQDDCMMRRRGGTWLTDAFSSKERKNPHTQHTINHSRSISLINLIGDRRRAILLWHYYCLKQLFIHSILSTGTIFMYKYRYLGVSRNNLFIYIVVVINVGYGSGIPSCDPAHQRCASLWPSSHCPPERPSGQTASDAPYVQSWLTVR